MKKFGDGDESWMSLFEMKGSRGVPDIIRMSRAGKLSDLHARAGFVLTHKAETRLRELRHQFRVHLVAKKSKSH